MTDLTLSHGFQSISYNVEFTNNKGKKLYDSNHVKNVVEIKCSNGWSYIKGSVIRQTSVTLEPWKVTLEVNNLYLYISFFLHTFLRKFNFLL